MSDGHAETAPETTGLAGLAEFLSDTPKGTAKEPEQELADDATDEAVEGNPDGGDDTADDADDQSDDAEAEGDEPEVDGEEEPQPAPDRKIKVTVKSDDGEESTIEVGEQELVKGYQRQTDYTRKTQQLAERENQAVQFLRGKHEEVVNHYLERAEATRAAIIGMAGIKSESEMAQLAHSDPQAWVAESQRQQSISSYLSQLDQQIAGEKQQITQQREQARQEHVKSMFQKTWAKLAEAKIDKPTLGKIYGETAKTYGFTPAELGEVYDHRIVMMMKDATAYRALQSKKAEVTKRIEAAPKLPSKQASTAQERNIAAMNARFKNGRAKLDDLAAFLR